MIAQQLAHPSVLFEERVTLALRPLEASLRPDQLAAQHGLIFGISLHVLKMAPRDGRDNGRATD
ncbi:MAG TPA: hypothetical protein VFE11_09030 [Dongiaceae bacterium]|nr:hypothetical protein [Dongiaceae bacterium]